MATAAWSRELSRREIGGLCLIAIGLHVLPLILADYPYLDDAWRAFSAGRTSGSHDPWSAQGRILMAGLHALLGFANATPNLFPLPLLLVISLVAWAFSGLVFHYFQRPTATALWVVLPLWFNPFFLQNLSYQYDGPGMALSLAVCAWGITIGVERWTHRLAGTVLVAVALSLYQVSVNVFASLACIEIVRRVMDTQRLAGVLRLLTARTLQVVGGCLLYYLTAHQLNDGVRSSLLPLDHQWPLEMGLRLGMTVGHLMLLVMSGPLWMILALLLLAALGLGTAIYRVAGSGLSLPERLGLVAALLFAVAGSALLIPGLSLLFSSQASGARLLMGFGPAMVLLSYLAYRFLTCLDYRAPWLLIVPLLFMLSFAFAYGRVLVWQKQVENQVASTLAYVVESDPRLRGTKRFVLAQVDANNGWIPAAEGSFEVMPALSYILNIRWLILAESMTRIGSQGFSVDNNIDRAALAAFGLEPVLESRLYSIYRADDVGFVLMKPLPRVTSAP